jgi:hypothetical protein
MVLATACDSAYATRALNLISSVQQNSDIFERIVVYDLGLDRARRWLLSDLPQVVITPVPAFCEHSLVCWGWKAWIWTHAQAQVLLYLDAGVEVLRSLEPVRALIERDGYFLVSQSEPARPHLLREIVPSDYYARFGVSQATHAASEVVKAGVIGFEIGGAFSRKVTEPVYRAVCEGAHVGWSRDELVDRNVGIHYVRDPVIRDCAVFRHDQTLLNVCLYKAYPRPRVQDLARFAGERTPTDHPEQLLWHHRSQSTLAYTRAAVYATRPRAHRAVIGIGWYFSRHRSVAVQRAWRRCLRFAFSR